MSMNAVNSELELLDFSILESKITTNFSQEHDPKDVVKDKPVDIDYMIQQKASEGSDEAKKRYFRIFMTISSNYPPTEPGYGFVVKAGSVVCIPSELEEPKVNHYLLYSGIPLMINSIRSFVSQITGQGPFGRYQFPTIDLTSVIKSSSGNKEVETP